MAVATWKMSRREMGTRIAFVDDEEIGKVGKDEVGTYIAMRRDPSRESGYEILGRSKRYRDAKIILEAAYALEEEWANAEKKHGHLSDAERAAIALDTLKRIM